MTLSEQCWEWVGGLSPKGYGRVCIAQKECKPHRVVYTEYFGEVAADLDINHLCLNRLCYNPSHLEAVTRTINNQKRGQFTGSETHCKRGHERRGPWARCYLCKELVPSGRR